MNDTTKLNIILEEKQPKQISKSTNPNNQTINQNEHLKKEKQSGGVFSKIFKTKKANEVRGVDSENQSAIFVQKTFNDRTASQIFEKEASEQSLKAQKIYEQDQKEAEIKIKTAPTAPVQETAPIYVSFDQVVDDYETVETQTKPQSTNNLKNTSNFDSDSDWDLISGESLKVFTAKPPSKFEVNTSNAPDVATAKSNSSSKEKAKQDQVLKTRTVDQLNPKYVEAFDELFFKTQVVQPQPCVMKTSGIELEDARVIQAKPSVTNTDSNLKHLDSGPLTDEEIKAALNGHYESGTKKGGENHEQATTTIKQPFVSETTSFAVDSTDLNQLKTSTITPKNLNQTSSTINVEQSIPSQSVIVETQPQPPIDAEKEISSKASLKSQTKFSSVSQSTTKLSADGEEEWLRAEILRISKEIKQLKKELNEEITPEINTAVNELSLDAQLNAQKTTSLEKELNDVKSLTQNLKAQTQRLESEITAKMQPASSFKPTDSSPNQTNEQPKTTCSFEQFFTHKTVKINVGCGDFLAENFKTQKLEQSEPQISNPTVKLNTQIIKTVKIANLKKPVTNNSKKIENEHNKLLDKLIKRLDIA